MNATLCIPPFDPELVPVIPSLVELMPYNFTADMIAGVRELHGIEPTREQLQNLGLECRDVTIPGYEGAELVASIISRPDHQGTGPGIYHTHGGGMIFGNRLVGIEPIASWIVDHGAVLVSVEYRLAPEFPDPYPVEDCYAGLVWTQEHALELGIDPDRILVAGGSAGGGLAAGVALLARDRQGPQLHGQVLMCPMLDDRLETVSSKQIDGIGFCDRSLITVGWEGLLGDRIGTDEVSIYAAPSRATDLAGLPPAFIDCGSMEVFRDEDVTYASRLWASGTAAELHVWPGGFHGFDGVVPHAAVSQAAIAARNAWVARMIGEPAKGTGNA